jgi:hypothetical protein
MIKNIEITETGIEEERIVMLEKKVRELEPLVKGLAAEVLSLRTGAFAVNRQGGKEPAGLGVGFPEPAGSVTSPIIAVPKKPAMVRIMQDDGTMEMEPRFGEAKTLDVSAGYVRPGKNTSDRDKTP